MADFPNARHHLPIISSFGPEGPELAAGAMLGVSTAAGGTAPWPSANLAIYVPIRIWSPYVVRRFWWGNGTPVSGNVDIGIYSVGGTLITSTGSTAQSGTTTIQTVTPTQFVLSPGSYYMALACNNTTGQFQRVAQGAVVHAACGLAQQATAFALPAGATFAAYTQTFQPMFGIASATVI